MNDSDIRILHLIELKMLLEIDRICKKNNIRYFLHSGTLIGVVRHKGFIPWDDDVDVGMSRSDYKHFLDVCQNELGSEYFMQTTDTESEYVNVFGQLRLNETIFPDMGYENVLSHTGIYIDIFPFDYVSQNRLLRLKQQIIIATMDRILHIKYNYKLSKPDKQMSKIHLWICRRVSPFISKECALHLRDKNIYKYSFKPSDYCANWPCSVKSSKILNGTMMMEFETFQFPVPIAYEAYLNDLYGDWRKIPPEGQRQQHCYKTPDFGPYASITLEDIKNEWSAQNSMK